VQNSEMQLARMLDLLEMALARKLEPSEIQLVARLDSRLGCWLWVR